MAISRFDGCRSAMLRPSTRMSPSVIDSKPAIVLSKVDLPQPDGPTSTRKPPFSNSTLMPLRISNEPKRFLRPEISRKAIGLSFNRARHQATHEVAAGENVDEEGRKRCD